MMQSPHMPRLRALAAQTAPRQGPEPRAASGGEGDAPLRAGVARVDITEPDVTPPTVDVNRVDDAATATPIDNPMYAKALLIAKGGTTVGFVTLDLVSFGQIGHITMEFLPRIRARVQRELGLDPANLVFNVNHGHGVPCDDVEERTFSAIAAAAASMVPVALGTGRGHEDRIQENRRMFLKDGSESDVRGAYALPPDEEVEGIGPIDPSIGVLRLDRLSDGAVLAVLFNFACHPIMGTPSGGNGADLTGYAAELIEDGCSPGVTVALFLQGCSGDVNPIGYKDVDRPKDALPLGQMLGHSVLQAARAIVPRAQCELRAVGETLQLPRVEASARIVALEAERDRLVASLQGTHLDLKMFVPLLIKYQLGGDFPSGHATRYRHEEALGRDGLAKLDDTNRAHLAAYIDNVHAMEAITRINTNLALLRMHREKAEEAGGADVPLVRKEAATIYVDVAAGRVPRRASALSDGAVCARRRRRWSACGSGRWCSRHSQGSSRCASA